MILAVVGVGVTPVPAHAECASLFDGINFGECVTELSAWFGNILLTLASYIVTATATLLSFSLKLTLNIGEIYNSTPAIRNVWVIIRNISSILIIFFLIYTSIKTILGIGDGVQKLVFKIILAGLFINFSLFFVKIAIDASNIVSLQFYRAIAPQYSSQEGIGTLGTAYFDGGLSNIFMSSLKLQKIYHPDNSAIKQGGKGEGTIFWSIIIATYGGVILMLFAALSFLGAAIAFTVRTAFLLLLMAFSPVYFAGMIFPEIKKDVSDVWLKYLTQQLFFMPIYLFLMYVALRIISDEGFLSFIQDGNLQNNKGGFVYTQIGIVIQYFIAILFINAPLIAAIKFGAVGSGWVEKIGKDFRGKLYNQPSAFAQHTLGRAAKWSSDKIARSEFATKNPNLAVVANKAFGDISKQSFGGTKGGYDKRYKDYVKERTDYATKGIKLSESYKEEYVNKGMGLWDAETENLRKNLAVAKTLAANTTISERARREAREKVEDLEKKITDRTSEEGKKKQTENLEKQALRERKEEYAKNLEKKGSIWTGARAVGAPTSKANKDAADSIRKELNKGKDKKALDAIKDLFEEDKPKEEKSEEKPKTT